MYEINNMKLRYTLIGVLCFSINIVLQAQQQALEGKIAGFLKGKKATVGVAVLTKTKPYYTTTRCTIRF